MTYVRNANLTLEYIVMRAFQLGARTICTEITPGRHHPLIIEWPDNEVITYPMGPWREKSGYRHPGFAANLPSLRRAIEAQGIWVKLTTQAAERQRVTTCINCLEYAKTKCDGCKEPLCFDCNQLLNKTDPNGDGLCWKCREKKAGTYDGD